MKRTLYTTLTTLCLALGSVTGCDHDAGDRTEVREHEIVGLAAWEADGHAFTLLSFDGATRIVATGTVADVAVVVIATEDGTPLAAIARDEHGSQYADMSALSENGDVVLRTAPPVLDDDSAGLLEVVLAEELELASFRAGLVADSDPAELPIGCAIDWVIRAIDNAINTPDLVMPTLGEWCG
jgi:hypothetical protein